MIETEWLTCQDPEMLLKFLWDSTSGRKLRLFGCACCRRIWDLIPEGWGQYALELAERFPDEVREGADRHEFGWIKLPDRLLSGTVDIEVDDRDVFLGVAEEAADCLTDPGTSDVMEYDGNYKKAIIRARRSFAWAKKIAADAIYHMRFHPDNGIYITLDWSDTLAARAAGWAALSAWAKTFPDQEEITDEAADVVNAAAEVAERTYQSCVLKDLVGNPFRPASIDPGLRTRTVVSLAQAAYDERLMPSGVMEPSRLAVLADALEEAGAIDTLTEHLREPGPHVRGCFVVDSCLGLS
jgi:hypothetical protein